MFETFENLPVFSFDVEMYGQINKPPGLSSVMPSGYSCRGKIAFLLSLPRGIELRVKQCFTAVYPLCYSHV